MGSQTQFKSHFAYWIKSHRLPGKYIFGESTFLVHIILLLYYLF